MSELKLERLARIEAKLDTLIAQNERLLEAMGDPESEPIVGLDDTSTAHEREQRDEL